MKYSIVHKTAYHYSEPASLSQNELFLQPRETGTQRVIQSGLIIVPEPTVRQPSCVIASPRKSARSWATGNVR